MVCLIKLAKLYLFTQNTEDRCTAPDVRGHGLVPLSHSGNILTRIGIYLSTYLVCSSMFFFIFSTLKALGKQTTKFIHTCDISRFRRELPIWSLSSRSHSRETKPPDERFFQCHFSRTVFLSEHFIVYGSIYLANKLFTAQKVSELYRSN